MECGELLGLPLWPAGAGPNLLGVVKVAGLRAVSRATIYAASARHSTKAAAACRHAGEDRGGACRTGMIQDGRSRGGFDRFATRAASDRHTRSLNVGLDNSRGLSALSLAEERLCWSPTRLLELMRCSHTTRKSCGALLLGMDHRAAPDCFRRDLLYGAVPGKPLNARGGFDPSDHERNLAADGSGESRRASDDATRP